MSQACPDPIWGTEIAYKAQSPGKSATHEEAQGSGDRVNAAVASWQFTFLSGEIYSIEPSSDDTKANR